MSTNILIPNQQMSFFKLKRKTEIHFCGKEIKKKT